MSADLAFSVGLLAGWCALVVWLVWPNGHACHDLHCAKHVAELERQRKDRIRK